MAPSQHAETMETILALKRKIRRDKEAAVTAEPIQSTTNRYNKLKSGASYVRTGSLPYPRGPTGYKQPIEHAGYNRNILSRNPRRYNDHGDELEDSESDPEADADAQEENPYSGIRLEELLGPLKHPSDLATHPSLSIPYRDPALADMVATTEEKLRQERVHLWNAKALQRQLMGDALWMPLERVEAPNDWDLFEPKPQRPADASKKRKRDDDEPVQNGLDRHNHVNENTTADSLPEDDMSVENAANGKSQPGAPDSDFGKRSEEDIPMPEADRAPHVGKPDNWDSPSPTSPPNDASHNGALSQNQHPTDSHPTHDNDDEDNTPPPPSRRITRALAAETDPLDAPTPSSTTSFDPSLLIPDPIFLLPPHLQTSLDPNARLQNLATSLHLPADELLETRRLLTMYIQKQEESVRGYEALLQKLFKAKHMKEQLWEWCNAEGHVGEWSDGEDYIDDQAWGLGEGELRKGKDEDEVAAEEREKNGAAAGDGERGGAAGNSVSNGVAIGGGRVKGKGRRRRAAAAASALTAAANSTIGAEREKERAVGGGNGGGE